MQVSASLAQKQKFSASTRPCMSTTHGKSAHASPKPNFSQQGTTTQNVGNIQHWELLKLVAWAQEDNQVMHTKSNVKQNTECTLTCHFVTFDSNALRTLQIGQLATKMVRGDSNSTPSNSVKK